MKRACAVPSLTFWITAVWQTFVGFRPDLAVPLAQVIVVEDENGNIVRETMKDTDTLARYKTMHETLVYLSHLDHDDTENQMLEKLRLQVRACARRCCRCPNSVAPLQWPC